MMKIKETVQGIEAAWKLAEKDGKMATRHAQMM
jgi:hypothetical protein